MTVTFETVFADVVVENIGRAVHLVDILQAAQARGATICECPRRCARDTAAEIGARCLRERYFFDAAAYARIEAGKAAELAIVQAADDRYGAGGFNEDSQLATVYRALRRPVGASVEELQEALAASGVERSAGSVRIKIHKLREAGLRIESVPDERRGRVTILRHRVVAPRGPRTVPLYVPPGRYDLDAIARHFNRDGPSRSGLVLDLVRRPEGASVAEAAELVAQEFSTCSTDVVTRALRMLRRDHAVEISRRRTLARGWVYRVVAPCA